MKARDTVTRATKIDTNIINCISTLSAPIEGKSAGGKIELTSVKNAKPKGAKDTTDKVSPYAGASAAVNDMLADIAKKEKMYDELKKNYGFTDEEIKYINKNAPDLLYELYNSKAGIKSKAYKEIKSMIEYKKLLNQIDDEYVRSYAESHDLTYKQLKCVVNIQNVENHGNYDYTNKIKDMQVVAISLFNEGYNEAFVAGRVILVH